MADNQGRSGGEGSISLSFRSDDPAQNGKVEELFSKLVSDLRHLHGGVLFPLEGSCPVQGQLTASYVNDNGEVFKVQLHAEDVVWPKVPPSDFQTDVGLSGAHG